MPTTKKKTTTKKSTAKSCKCKNCKCKNCKCRKGISTKERAHVCLVACLSIVAGILLCADAAMIIVH